MTTLDSKLGPSDVEFVEQLQRDADLAFRSFVEAGTLSASHTFFAVERAPGGNLAVVAFPELVAHDQTVKVTLVSPEGEALLGSTRVGLAASFGPLFDEFPNVTSIAHVHGDYLGAWAQSHRDLPIRYAPVQRQTLSKAIPNYIDRRASQTEFILDRLREDPHVTAILEANGGATVWGERGFLALAQFIVLVEEGAKFQLLAESLGGAQDYGPGVLEQQWRVNGLTEKAAALGLLASN
ncbi:MAG: class II aldolase/adducin family protein [Acidimicrobiia bacterium]